MTVYNIMLNKLIANSKKPIVRSILANEKRFVSTLKLKHTMQIRQQLQHFCCPGEWLFHTLPSAGIAKLTWQHREIYIKNEDSF